MSVWKRTGMLAAVLLGLASSQAKAETGFHESIPSPSKWMRQAAENPDKLPLPVDWKKDWNASNCIWHRVEPVKGAPMGVGYSTTEGVNGLWLEAQLLIPASWKGRNVVLDFTSIGGDAIVFMNEKRIGEILNPDCEIDVTSALDFDKPNRLTIYFTRDYTGISRGYDQDLFLKQIEKDTLKWNSDKHPGVADRPLGLLYPLKIFCRPATAIADTFVIPSWRNKRIDLEIDTASAEPIENAVFSADIIDAEGKVVLQVKGEPVSVPAGKSVQKIGAAWSDFKTWELEAPYLYKAKVELRQKDKLLDKADPVRFGFREIWKDGIKFMMNGHPMRWRQIHPMGVDGVPNFPGVSFVRLMGYNFFFTPTHGPATRFAKQNEEWLDFLDEQGIGTSLPIAPQVSGLRGNLTKNPDLLAEYERNVAYYLKTIRNHPSVMSLHVGYNQFCPLEHINPQGMGRPAPYYADAYQVKFINAAYDAVKRHDPTRLVYSHADGATGDIASSNIYLNFAPLQEREEWPMMWAESGKLPYMAAEMGTPITACFWKNNYAMLMTEYCSIYQGPDAYKNESEAGLRKTLDLGLRNKTWGLCPEMDFEKDFHNVTDFYRLFVKNTNRAWRTWGVPGGWLYFDFDLALGYPPGQKKGAEPNLGHIKEAQTKRPDWATEFFDIHSEANKTLLAYIAGAPRHTDKTHSFYTGENVSKQIAIVYDGSVKKSYKADWVLEDAKGTKVTAASTDIPVDAGAIVFRPIEFKAPEVTDKTSFTIKMSLKENGVEVQADSFAIQVFPPFKPLKIDKGVAVFDPAGKSGKNLAKLGLSAAEWKPGTPNKGISLLIMGRESMLPGKALPYTKDDIKNGLKVLILEQMPQMWEAMGLRSIENMPRYVFTNDINHPVCKGLSPEDLINWRGTPNIYPEGKKVRSTDETQAPKWTNTHTVASSAIQVPEVVGFKPILSCEFDLNYSPLLQWLDGKGQVVFCSLDISERIGVDPAATLLASNLLSWLATENSMPRRERCQYWGDANGKNILERLKVKIDPGFELNNPDKSIVIIGSNGEGDRPGEDALAAFAKKGGRVVYLSRTEKELSAMGLTIEKKDIVRTAPPVHPLFQGIGQNLLRWRDALKVPMLVPKQTKEGIVLGDGLFMISENDKGGLRFISQFDPTELETRHKESKPHIIAVVSSIMHMRQLFAELLTNIGVAPEEKAAEKICNLDMGAEQETLPVWQVLGPFSASKDDGEVMMETKFDGEASAIAGDTNPNIKYIPPDGAGLDWRETVNADSKGVIDLKARLKPKGPAVAYVTRIVNSEKARTAILMLGGDRRIKVWVNGELVFKTLSAPPRPSMRVAIQLKQGDNIISMKIGSGAQKHDFVSDFNGFGFAATLSKPEINGLKSDPALQQLKFYEDGGRYKYDPYQFIYW